MKEKSKQMHGYRTITWGIATDGNAEDVSCRIVSRALCRKNGNRKLMLRQRSKVPLGSYGAKSDKNVRC